MITASSSLEQLYLYGDTATRVHTNPRPAFTKSANVDPIVYFNIGGQRIQTHLSTLAAYGDNQLTKVVQRKPDASLPHVVDAAGNIFIDTDPDLFNCVLSYLRTGEWNTFGVSYRLLCHLTKQLELNSSPGDHIQHKSAVRNKNVFLNLVNTMSSTKAAKFNGGEFPNLEIEDVNFTGSDFQRCNIANSTFTSCSFKRALFKECKNTNCTFVNCAFENTKVLQNSKCDHCSVQCCCFCGGKNCSFEFTNMVFLHCDFFGNEEFESHPMAFTNCQFQGCKLNISLYNVSAPKICFTSCTLVDCVFSVVFGDTQQLNNMPAVQFIKTCMRKCLATGTVVMEVCKDLTGTTSKQHPLEL